MLDTQLAANGAEAVHISASVVTNFASAAWAGNDPGSAARRSATRDGVDGGGEQQDDSGDHLLPLRAEARLQSEAVRNDRDDQRTDDRVAWLAASAEQGRAADDRGRHREQQDVAGAEVERGRRLRRGQ